MIVWWVFDEKITSENDEIDSKQIPLCDNLLEISMPETPLTEILSDFRSYRPGNHRQFLEWVKDRAQDVGVRGYAMMDRKSAGKAMTKNAPCSVLSHGFSVISSCAEPSP